MTPRTTDDRPQMLVEEFEQIERTAPESVRLEFINGKIEVDPVPDGNHDEIVMWLVRRCMQHRPELTLYTERGLRIGTYARAAHGPTGRWRLRGTSRARANGPSPTVCS